VCRLQDYLTLTPPPESFALAYDVMPSNQISSPTVDSRFSLAELFDGFLWGAVPKSRRSRERGATRKFGSHKIREYMTPKRNLVSCLDCGAFHEVHSICGQCYQKVRDETEAMRARMDPDLRLYSAPSTEVVYVYAGEEDQREKYKGKYIVEMDKPRPEWFPKNLLTKGRGGES